MKKFALALAAVAAPAVGQADENPWLAAASSSDGAVYYIRYHDVAKGSVDFWVKVDRVKQKASVFRSSMIQYRAACTEQKLGVLQAVDYRPDGTGKSAGPFSYPAMNAVPPESIGEAILKAVCPSQPTP